jgi:hypothetical protein
VNGYFERIRGWSHGCILPHECSRLPPTYEKWIFLAGLTILKKETCLDIVSGCRSDPTVALRLRNAADYCLPTFEPHGTILGHSRFQWKLKTDFTSRFDNSEKGDVCGTFQRMGGGDPVVAFFFRNGADYRLTPFGPHGTKLGHSWFQWKMKSDFYGRFDNSEIGDVSGHFERMQKWSRGCIPPQECCILPPTNFWATWHQTWAYLISMKKWKDIFLAGLTIKNKKTCLDILSACGADRLMAFHLMNAAYYCLPTSGPHGTNKGILDFNEKWKVMCLADLTI